MEKQNNNALTAQDTGFQALADSDLGAMMAEELDGLDAGFERIKIPSAGSTVFEVPGEEDGEPDAVKEFSAVILHHHPLHAYYSTKYTGGNQPPDCASFDGVTGEGEPGGSCRKCPLNQFGSGENGAKACKNRRRIYVLREGEIFPLLLSLPTGSLQEFTRYIKAIVPKTIKKMLYYYKPGFFLGFIRLVKFTFIFNSEPITELSNTISIIHHNFPQFNPLSQKNRR
jgi:hypothetical protein